MQRRLEWNAARHNWNHNKDMYAREQGWQGYCNNDNKLFTYFIKGHPIDFPLIHQVILCHPKNKTNICKTIPVY